MKRFSILFLFAALTFTAVARQVNVATVRQAAAFYFSEATGSKAPAADDLDLALQLDNPTLCLPSIYAFNMPGGGWVVASATDCVEPILAYSPDGKIDANQLGSNMEFLLGRYNSLVCANQIAEIENATKGNGMAARKWQELLDETFVGHPAKSAVLLQTKWGQGDPNEPTYNCMCPIDGGKPSITGCVAVAMAQIIKYWEYPVQGGTRGYMSPSVMWRNTRIIYDFNQDSNKFEYENMPNKVKTTSSWEQRHAVGKLMFAVGVCCKMDWSTSASSANSNNVFIAYPRYFNYSPECQYTFHDDMGGDQWVSTLRSETRDFARPVYISARTAPDENNESDGHAFVACGVSGSDSNKIYLNLGWDGSENGFFTMNPVSEMGETGGYVFNQSMGMIHHLHPKTEGIDENTIYTSAPVHPNPASNYVMIPAGLSLNALLSVYTLDGRLVETAVVPGGTHEYRLDLSRYPAGTYVYRLNGACVKFVKE